MVSRAARVWLPSLVLVGVVVAMVRLAARPLGNTDTYFHLRFGHEFLHGWSLRDPGSVSTFATAHWVPTQWLSEVVMARTEDWFGLAGVAWLSGLLQVGLFVGVYAACRRRAAPLVAMPVTAVALLAMQGGLSMRPQVVSYLCAAVVVSLQVVSGALRWSVRRPFAVDMRSARATPAPPLVMVGYSTRLALSTTVTGLLFRLLARLPEWTWSVLVAVPFLLFSAWRLAVTAREWSEPETRARVIAVVSG